MLKELLIFAAISSSVLHCNAQKLSKTAQELEKQGYVNIHTLDKTIVVDLMYSRADNFTGKVLYTDLKEAYLE
ncbi:MAG: D-alanyl-D-alanine dipeptidase, partial [Bacteroidaceae bacterium]|nr:D-alanyl-D-alanine dipeptidase [Bacteroidaceae bacterium]